MGDRYLHIDCASRPFKPGMLYDYPTDSLVPGCSLWPSPTVAEHTTSLNNISVQSDCRTSTSFTDKCQSLGIEASLQCSFLAGMVQLNGNSAYLSHTPSKMHSEKATFVYRAQTKFVEFDVHTPCEHKEILDKRSLGTHVVTGVQYGGNAVFTFERKRSSDLTGVSTKGNLAARVRKAVTRFSRDAHADIEEEGDYDEESVSVHYFGDYILEETPTSFSSAISAISKIPALARKVDTPMRAHLIPLSYLYPPADKITYKVNEELITVLGKYYSELREVSKEASSLEEDPVGWELSMWKAMVREFRSSVDLTLSKLESKLGSHLPVVRRTGIGEDALLNEVRHLLENSATPLHLATKWLSYRRVELARLSAHVKAFEETDCALVCFEDGARASELGKLLESPALEVRVPTRLANALLLKGGCVTSLPEDGAPGLSECFVVDEVMMKVARFARANAKRKGGDLRVIVTDGGEVSEEKEARVVVKLHGAGLQARNFDVPSAPTDVIAKLSSPRAGHIEASWKAPVHGESEIRGYVVKMLKDDESITVKCFEATERNGSVHAETSGKIRVRVAGLTEAGETAEAECNENLLERQQYNYVRIKNEFVFETGKFLDTNPERVWNSTYKTEVALLSKNYSAQWIITARGGKLVTLWSGPSKNTFLAVTNENCGGSGKAVSFSQRNRDSVECLWKKQDFYPGSFTLETLQYPGYFLVGKDGVRTAHVSRNANEARWRIV